MNWNSQKNAQKTEFKSREENKMMNLFYERPKVFESLQRRRNEGKYFRFKINSIINSNLLINFMNCFLKWLNR